MIKHIKSQHMLPFIVRLERLVGIRPEVSMCNDGLYVVKSFSVLVCHISVLCSNFMSAWEMQILVIGSSTMR